MSDISGNKLFPKKEFLIEFFFLFLVVASIFIFLNDGRLDLDLAKLFYHPEMAENFWPEQKYFLWKFFYFAAPVLTAVFILPALFIFILSFIKLKWAQHRKSALLIILIVLLGPGLFVNSVFKPLWGRPRPREVIQFGGTQTFQNFITRGVPRSGMSFPCGHCSVGFSTIALYFLLKRRRKKLAFGAFLFSTSLGLLMGVGRMADGAHFFSDVLWAGMMTYLPAFFLYYVLGLYKDQIVPQLNQKKALLFGIIFSFILILAVCLATPFKENKKFEIAENRFQLEIEEGIVEVIVDDQIKPNIFLQIEAQGFGFPRSHINYVFESSQVLKSVKNGFFTDFEARYKIKVKSSLDHLHVRIINKGVIIKPAHINSHYIFEEPTQKESQK